MNLSDVSICGCANMQSVCCFISRLTSKKNEILSGHSSFFLVQRMFRRVNLLALYGRNSINEDLSAHCISADKASLRRCEYDRSIPHIHISYTSPLVHLLAKFSNDCILKAASGDSETRYIICTRIYRKTFEKPLTV